MIECSECDHGKIKSVQTPYGCKEVCDACNYIAKDVDTYAGVMVWSHKTAPEIEIHASKSSAQAVLGSNRARMAHGDVQVRHHAPREMGGRRQNAARVEPDAIRSNRIVTRDRKSQAQRSVVIPLGLRPYVREMSKEGSTGMRTFTSFTADDVKKVLAALPCIDSMEELCQHLGLRSGKEKKPVGILSWLSSFGHAEPSTTTVVWQDGNRLVLKDGSEDTIKSCRGTLDVETRRALGYKSATSCYI